MITSVQTLLLILSFARKAGFTKLMYQGINWRGENDPLILLTIGVNISVAITIPAHALEGTVLHLQRGWTPDIFSPFLIPMGLSVLSRSVSWGLSFLGEAKKKYKAYGSWFQLRSQALYPLSGSGLHPEFPKKAKQTLSRCTWTVVWFHPTVCTQVLSHEGWVPHYLVLVIRQQVCSRRNYLLNRKTMIR